MNIAILIGISKYQTQSGLPACLYDAENMHQLLLATRKYDDIQLVTKHTTASQVKDVLREFFSKHQGQESIEEAFIYFSGHGLYQRDALLCCSDFDVNRPATTSISNGELDDLLRSIKPNVAVKVIDACQSGSPYIKDANSGFEKALSTSQLDSFVCMASSRQDQSSYASSTESLFTSRWIDSALSKPEGQILYRDIQAALADAFVSNPSQTPFFVNQGTGLEVFTAVTEDMRTLLVARSKDSSITKLDATIEHAIQAKVHQLDRQFVPHAKVLRAAQSSKDALTKKEISDEIVSKFYKMSVNVDGKLGLIPKSQAVASFAEENSWPKRYFVKIKQEAYKTRVPKDPFLRTLGISARMFSKYSDDDYVIETKYRPGSLETTEPLPIEVVELYFTSEHPSLAEFAVYIGIVHSLTEAMILSSTARLVQKGWDSKAPELNDLQWRYQSYPWTEVVQSPDLLWHDPQSRGESEVRSYLESLAQQSTKETDSNSGLPSGNESAGI